MDKISIHQIRERNLPQELEHSERISSFSVDQTFSYFKKGSNEFKAGILRHYFQQWKKITGDKKVLKTISATKLDFENETPENNILYEQCFSKEDENSIEIEIKTIFLKRNR